jgi:succinylglutamate desuccinylase
MIKQLNKLPTGLLELDASELYTKIDDHTLIHLEGKIKRPIFISVLQHGDEYTGWDALKDYLNNHQHILPRSVSIFFGNIQAARHNVRQMQGQPDFNRCWPSDIEVNHELGKKFQEVTDIMRDLHPFASVDIHNNSGRNPHYSGINSLDVEFLNLASLFSDTMIHFTSPKGIQSGAFAEFCPSVTVECGLSGTADGREQTHTFLELLFSLSNLKEIPGYLERPIIYQVVATVKVKEEIDISFKQDNCDFKLIEDLDYLNFRQTDVGTIFGSLNLENTKLQLMPFQVLDQNGIDQTNNYFSVIDNKIINSKDFVPSMITQNITAIRHDCLCYLMQPIPMSP